MPDLESLESRLRAEAGRPIAPPDLDEALRAVIAADRRTTRDRRRPTRSWLAAAAAVVAVLAGAVALTLGTGRDNHGSRPAASHSPAGLSFTPRITGIVFGPKSKHPEYMLFTTAPRATPVKGRTANAAKYCVDFTQVKVIETATQVRLRPVVLHRRDGRFRCETEGLPDPRTGNLLAGSVTGLKHPLGDRTVVDDRTGRPVEVFAPTYATPGYLPSGYAAKYGNDTNPMTTTWSDTRPGFLAPMSFAHAFGPDHGPQRDKPGGLVVIEAPYDSVNPGAKIVDHVSIDGHDATVTEIATARCVTWSAAGHGRQVCDDTKYLGHTGLLSENVLVRVARSLP